MFLHSNPSIGSNAFESNHQLHLVLDDATGSDFNTENANTFESASYIRELAPGKYGTIMLPFAPRSDKYVFFSVASEEDGVLTFEEEDEPQANTPYLYRLRVDAENAPIASEGTVSISSAMPEPDENTEWKMVGSFTAQVIDTESDAEKSYYGYTSSDNKLHMVTKKMTVKPYRAYFTSTSSFDSQLLIRVRSKEEVTSIKSTDVEGWDSEMFYDLNDRLVENPAHGIYIQNGKKVIFK